MSGRGENLTVRSYTVAEGLAHDHVSRIYRDSHGFLWICTDEGLSRFDGHAFVNYTAESGLPHIHVNDIVETRGGDYWVATDGGVTLFRPGHASQKFRTYKPEGPPQALFTNAVAEEASGAVLVGTAAGLYRLYPNDGSARLERIEFGAPPSGNETAGWNVPFFASRRANRILGYIAGIPVEHGSGLRRRMDCRSISFTGLSRTRRGASGSALALGWPGWRNRFNLGSLL